MAQINHVLRLASEHEYNDVTVYADNGALGHNFDRSEFMRLSEDIEAGKIGAVFVHSVDRIIRNAILVDRWLSQMEQQGITVKAVDGSCGRKSADFMSLLSSYIQMGGGMDGA